MSMPMTAFEGRAGGSSGGAPASPARMAWMAWMARMAWMAPMARRGLGALTARGALHTLVWALALPLLPACAPVVVKALPSLDCPVPAERLAARCAAPVAVADGSNYGQALQAWAVDRKALADCRDREALLISTVQACQAAIAQHNAQLRALEQQGNAGR